ncbi:fatty acid cis/trans isomerase [Dasania marina]|uniref:fatty acid cis/trans isomerase n=1 Tax=Dasania marina TaxID=471499 RepID=UPI00036420BB|nr:fatty acid cis/trans isomerase [Dasania marina]
MKYSYAAVLLVVLSGCVAYAGHQLDQRFGEPQVRDRVVSEPASLEYRRDVKSILDNRCVVCHGCYDAPCQLKLSSFEGIDRGATKDKVYDGRRILSSNLSRLFIDADNTRQWRDKGFYPVLNEREQSPQNNLDGSLMYRLLTMKQHRPLPEVKQLGAEFDFNLNRDQQCPKIEEIDSFERNYPQWGMPYGLPGLNAQEFNKLKLWLQQGATVRDRVALSPEYQNKLLLWESFLNGDSNKHKLSARYIYEHLFIANLYFPDLPAGEYFRLVRSATASGEPIQVIPTRRPYDDPGAAPFYYRLQRVDGSITAKEHMPYRLDAARMMRWHQWFIKADYQVAELPSYNKKQSANPFITFEQLPIKSRYQFMLEEAAFTINGFIKGPVCRGQIALNVIDDHFWVLFVEPDETLMHNVERFLKHESEVLGFPAEKSSQTLPLLNWLAYSKSESEYIKEKESLKSLYLSKGKKLDLNFIWDGDGDNDNLALTVFRHFDSATVKKGLLGKQPKTAWLIDYPLLERIHYLLVSGFDVYGNTGHQLLTRLYMDFLRMEGERNFLNVLPSAAAKKELAFWYRDEEESVQQFIDNLASGNDENLAIDYQTDNPKAELFELVQQRVGNKLLSEDKLNRPVNTAVESSYMAAMQRLANFNGAAISYLPEVLLIRVQRDNTEDELYTLLSNRARSNVLTLLRERSTLMPKEQTVTLVQGVVGAYPNIFVQVPERQIADFVAEFTAIDSEQAYRKMLDSYGVRRTSSQFWPYSDWLHNYYQRREPIGSGLLDYNRIENR